MWNSKKSTGLSITVCVLTTIILLILIVFGPYIFENYLILYRGFNPDGQALSNLKLVFCCCFYPSSIFAGLILYSLIRLLINIKQNKIFTRENVASLRTVGWCCYSISFITLIGGFFYLPFFFICAAGGFTATLLRVLKNVMQSAVELSQENELTI